MATRRGIGLPVAAMLVGCLAGPPAPAATLPRKSPELAIALNGGKQLLLSSYKGKAVVLAFILTTCPHCQRTTGLLKQLQAEYGPRGLQVVEAAIDQGAEPLVPGFLARFQPNFPVGFVQYESSSEFLQHDNSLILHVPALVFIDRQGSIRTQYEGDDPFFTEEKQEKNLREQIEKLLQPAALTGKAAPKKTAVKNEHP